MKVLIVDNNVEFCEIICEFMSIYSDIQVVGIAPNGQVALEMIHTMRPDVVLLDMFMPILDGMGVLRQLSQQKNTCSPKIIALTTDGREKTAQEAVELGACCYIYKPMSLEYLLNKIRSL